MNAEVHHSIAQFLYREAYLLDYRRYLEWLELLADDIVYRMPVRVTTVNEPGSTNIVNDMAYVEETKSGLTIRAQRLFTKSAWAENPAPRQRHFVSNIRVEAGPRENEYVVRSYFLFKRSRSSEPGTEELFGEREDILRQVDGQWRIARRTVYPDQAVLSVMNLSMFL
ncbi:MAG: 3-phenylpropionate/cinnamic acid dioxygenase subunit beta [Alicyclobacillaceae bacterium]|nr:3-phenylpropionate/cinnamic acid dioxygenase subunit beta [Alicyclobacillaceae bacterium]